MRLIYSSSLLLLLILSTHTYAQDVTYAAPHLDHLNDNNERPGVDGLLDADEAWGYAFASGVGISLIGFILSSIWVTSIWKKKTEEAKWHGTALIFFAFAMGSMLGNAVVILMPKAFGIGLLFYEINTSTQEDWEWQANLIFDSAIVSLLILVGFTFFFLCDLAARHMFYRNKAKDQNVATNVRNPETKSNALPNVMPVGTGVTGTNVTGTNVTGTNVVGTNVVGTNVLGTNATGYGVVPNNEIIGNTNVIGQPGSYPNPHVPLQSVNQNLNQNVDNRGSTEVSPREGRPKGGLGLAGSRKQTVVIVTRQILYNFFSGLAIGTAFSTKSTEVALLVSLAVLIHEIPFEMCDTLLLYYAGASYKTATCWNLFWNFIPHLIGIGAGRALGLIGLRACAYLFASVVGAFIYLSAVNLMPAVVKERRNGQKFCYYLTFIFGAGIMFALREIQE